MSSSELAEKLVQIGLSHEAARKRISRLAPPARTIIGLKLPKNARFLYHQQDFNSQLFRERLVAELKSSGSAYGRALIGLETQGGAVPQEHFPIVSGLSVINTRKQLRHDVVATKLKELGLINIIEDQEGFIVSLHDGSTLGKRRKAERIVEDILLEIVKTHLGRINLTSYGAGRTRGTPLPLVGPFNWDFSAPTYMSGLVQFGAKGVQPGFVVGDILLGRTVTKDDLAPFLAKFDTLTRQGRANRFVGFFVADFFEKQALEDLRARGCLIITPETLYGREFGDLLRQLALKIENASAALANDPDALFGIIRQLMKIEGAALNLRGVVLELMVGQIYAHDGYNFDLRKRIRTLAGDGAEIDVKAENRVECVCVECKAPLPGNLVGKEEIEKWVEHGLPRIKTWLKERQATPERVRFEFFSATEFHSDAKELIEKIETTHRKQPVRFYSGQEIAKRLQDRKLQSLVEIFNEQFGITFVTGQKRRLQDPALPPPISAGLAVGNAAG